METISQSLTEFITALPSNAQLIVIFLFSFEEGVPFLGSILPGGTVALLAGSLSALGFYPPLLVFSIITLGSFLGDSMGIFMGRHFKNAKWIQKIMEAKGNQKTLKAFDENIPFIAILGKLIPGVRSTPSLFAGVRGVSFRSYALYSFIGSALWSFIGVFGGNVLARYLGGNYAIMVILGILVISLLIFIIKYFINKAKNKNTE